MVHKVNFASRKVESFAKLQYFQSEPAGSVILPGIHRSLSLELIAFGQSYFPSQDNESVFSGTIFDHLLQSDSIDAESNIMSSRLFIFLFPSELKCHRILILAS